MLGTSKWTSIMGYVVIVLTVSNQVFVEQGLPGDVAGWIKLVGGIVMGVGLRLAKDANVSNASHPQSDAQPVK